MDWGIVTTVKAPADQIRAFVAHHLSLGAAHIWLYFDDPDDPALSVAKALPQVTAVPCDDAHWQKIGTRPDRHQNRQVRNAQRCWRRCPLPWLAHIDVDEFLLPAQSISETLSALHPDQVMLRSEPFEAMHDPALPVGIFSARQFRAALKPRHADLRQPILGRYADLLPEAMLSHTAGKAFFRTGVPGLSPRLHGGFMNGIRLPGPAFDPAVRLLHFHAQDRAAWLAALPFRLTRGAYQYHPELQAHLTGASPDEIAAFYAETQILTPAKTELLRSKNRLIEADLDLPTKVATLQKGPAE